MKHHVQIDWLSIFCDCSDFQPTSNFSIKRENYGTSTFHIVDNIFKGSERVAVLAHEPRTSVVKPHTGILKILNVFLYSDDLLELIHDIVCFCNIVPLSLSRLDLAVDFNKFDTNQDPQHFINEFLARKYVRKGRGQVKIIGNNARDVVWDYLRFGTYKTSVSAYLYNKSKEITEASGKNYIVESWRKQGLNTEETIWRIEFSLNGEDIAIQDGYKKTIYNKNLDTILESNFRTRLFAACLDKYFCFFLNSGYARKADNKRVRTLFMDPMELTISRIKYADTTTRADRILLHSLERVFDEMRLKNNIDAEIVEEATQKIILFKKFSNTALKK